MALTLVKTWHVQEFPTLEDMTWISDIGCNITVTEAKREIPVAYGRTVTIYAAPSGSIITSTTEEQEILLKLKYANNLTLVSQQVTEDWFGT